MRKTNKILIGMILISSLLLGVGYAAIQNITLDIEGTVSASPTWETLVAGASFNQTVKGVSSESTADTTITRIVFDYWSDGYSENNTVIYKESDWTSGTAIDANGTGTIRLFKSSDGTIAYILSKSNILANEDTGNMFQAFSNVTEITFNNFNTKQTTQMRYMFKDMSSLKSLDLSKFNTSSVSDMKYMFDGVSAIQELNLSSFDTRNVQSMSYMLANMTSLTKLDVSSFITTKVEGMNQMFYNTKNLASLDLSSFETPKATNMYNMFYGMSSLTYLDLRQFDFSKTTGYWAMFYKVPTTAKIIVKDETAKTWLEGKFGTSFATIVLVSEL